MPSWTSTYNWAMLFRKLKRTQASQLAIQCMANEWTRQTNKHRCKKIYILRKVGRKRRRVGAA